MDTKTIIGRAVSSTIYAKKETKDSDYVQMTARLEHVNNCHLLAYASMTGKNKNEALNDMLSIGLAVYADELEKEDKGKRDIYNNITHEIAGN